MVDSPENKSKNFDDFIEKEELLIVSIQFVKPENIVASGSDIN